MCKLGFGIASLPIGGVWRPDICVASYLAHKRFSQQTSCLPSCLQHTKMCGSSPMAAIEEEEVRETDAGR